MASSINCFNCTDLTKKIIVQPITGSEQYFRICSKKGFGDCLEAGNCANFEQRLETKEDVCYLFTEKEWEAIYKKQ